MSNDNHSALIQYCVASHTIKGVDMARQSEFEKRLAEYHEIEAELDDATDAAQLAHDRVLANYNTLDKSAPHPNRLQKLASMLDDANEKIALAKSIQRKAKRAQAAALTALDGNEAQAWQCQPQPVPRGLMVGRTHSNGGAAVDPLATLSASQLARKFSQ